jgi:hypothetical protein
MPMTGIVDTGEDGEAFNSLPSAIPTVAFRTVQCVRKNDKGVSFDRARIGISTWAVKSEADTKIVFAIYETPIQLDKR